MKYLKLSILTLCCVAFIVRPPKIAESMCAGGDENWRAAYNLFTPMSFVEFTDFWKKPDSTETANLNDWLAYLKNKPKMEDVRQVVYKLSANDMQQVRSIANDGKPVPSEWKNNTLIKYWQNNKDIEAIDYLFYAKTCEGQAGTFDDWEQPKRDMSKVKWLADAGKQYYKEKASNDFLRLRFAYQAIRMAQYSNQPQKGIAWYDELVQPLEGKINSPIQYWALAHKAGCLDAQGYKDKAGYLFAQIFDKCPSKRISSALSFGIENETQWQNALGMCKNNEEKASLYLIRSIDREANILAEMKAMYEVFPAHNKLHILLLREINRLENALLRIELKDNFIFLQKAGKTPASEALQKLKDLQAFVTKCSAEGKVAMPEVFALASGYLDFVAGNSTQALNKLEALAGKTKDAKHLKQISVCKAAIQLANLTKIDENVENDLYNEVFKLNHESLTDFMWHVCQRLYTQQGEVGKAYLCLEEAASQKYAPQLPVIDNLIAFTDKKKKTALEQALIGKISTVDAKAFLIEMKATCLFSQDKLEEAIALYQQVPPKMLGRVADNPLAYNIKHFGRNEEGNGKFNRLELAQKMSTLKKLAEKPNLDQAKQYFELGCIYYNLTFFGNSWDATDYFRSGTDMQQAYEKKGENSYANFDCSKAKYYFDRAMNVALKDQNRELAAKAVYLAAKCEQNQYYILPKHKDTWGFIAPSFEAKDRRYFTMLKNDFKDTQYYKEVLNECTYFNTFVKMK